MKPRAPMKRNQLAFVIALVPVLQSVIELHNTYMVQLASVAPLFPKHLFHARKCQYQCGIVLDHLETTVFRILLSTFKSRKSR